MNAGEALRARGIAQRLSEAEITIQALLSGQIDAVVDTKTRTPVLLSKAQHALRESEARYRRIVETANEGIWTVDAESKITFVNQPLAEMLGYPAAEMLGRSLFQFVPEASLAGAALRVDRSRPGISEENEVGFVRKDGSELWALLKTSPIRDTDGDYVGKLAMMTDRTRHRRAEEALRKSEEQYRQIVEATTDGIIKLDGAALIVFVNRRFAEMLGYEPGEMIGVSVFAFMGAATKDVAAAAFQKRRRGDKDTFDSAFHHKDRIEVSVNIACSSLVDEEGQHVGNLAVVRDVTERRKLQSQLMVSDRMASVGTLAAGVAHEINNPLAVVIANLEYIAENLGRIVASDSASVTPNKSSAWFLQELKAPLDDARDAAQRVRFIVRDLKTFSRSPTDDPRGPVDVEAVMESSLRMAWNEIRHRARLVKHFGVVPRVEANEGRLGQVFLNLVVNAAQSLQEGRAENNEIRVSTRHEGERVVIEVRDTGAGIPPEIIDRIFDAFFTTKAVGVGTGLGLAICQRIVTDMDGELTVESEVGRGTTFRVALPIARTEESEPAAPVDEAPVADCRGRILVVDDDTMVLRGVKRILSQQHEVVALATAKKALALCARREKFDLIICDLMMPQMTGMDLHRELLRIDPEQAKRMIFLTAGAFTPKASQFLAEAPNEHLDKPFDPADLRAIVQRHLRKALTPGL
jgi:two-component system cell cycle sensor histidine kinase/response regulator CckA